MSGSSSPDLPGSTGTPHGILPAHPRKTVSQAQPCNGREDSGTFVVGRGPKAPETETETEIEAASGSAANETSNGQTVRRQTGSASGADVSGCAADGILKTLHK